MSDKILKLSQAQTLYEDLRERIDALPTSEDITVTDVQVNGTSVLSQGVANVPVASKSILGTVRLNDDRGIYKNDDNQLYLVIPSDEDIKGGTKNYRAIMPSRQHKSTFYGLAKAAGADMKNIANTTVGIYPDAQKAAIQNMLGITDLISTEESSTATAAHAINSTFMMGGKLHRATAAIAIGDAVEVGTNCEVVKADEVFVKYTNYATLSTAGVVKVNNSYGLYMGSNGEIRIYSAPSSDIKRANSGQRAIAPDKQHESVFFGLSKLAGVDLANEEVTLGTYPETSKTAIRTLIGAAAASDIPSVPVQDVQVNGTSVLSQGVANVPIASDNVFGVMKIMASNGIALDANNRAYIMNATSQIIKTGTNEVRPITPNRQQESVFYGLAKAAGDATQAASSNAVGTYTDAAKTAIRNMLGATSSNVIAVQDEQPTDGDTKIWLPETESTGIEVPTYAEFQALDAAVVKDIKINGTSITSNNSANIPLASSSTFGVVKTGSGLTVSNNLLMLVGAGSNAMKAGTSDAFAITPWGEHIAAFYGLAKAAGDSTQSASSNAVGTYTDEAKSAIQTMLGVLSDVQVNGMSIVSSGVANIPKATAGVLGVCQPGGLGVSVNAYGELVLSKASSAQVKAGTEQYRAIVPYNQHESVFYALAKAAGVDMASSSNSVGTYTDAAKDAIQNMLGISDLISTRESSTATAAHAVNSLFLMDGKLHKATSAIAIGDAVAAGSNCQVVKVDEVFPHDVQINGTSVISNGIATIPLMGTNTYGVAQVSGSAYGIGTTQTRYLYILSADTALNKAGTHAYRPLTPSVEDSATFYGLAKAAGDSTQASSDNAVGTYTDGAKTAIRSMLGVVGTTDYATTSSAGIVKVNASNGITLDSNNTLKLNSAGSTSVKAASSIYPITCEHIHEAAFYGLAKAAGADEKNSTLALGTYSTTAQNAIKSMLGVETSVSLKETVSGTTPSITGVPNTIYECGELSTLSITPPANGTIDVYFTSGSTATVLTVPNTVKFPTWFDATALDANTIYEIMITNGVYGSVMTWAAT